MSRTLQVSGSLWFHALAVLAFAGLIAIGARLDVPMAPVPMSMQSFAVLLAGAMLGWRGGASAVLIYLAAGGLGLPVFADGASGWGRFVGPTGGYLLAFPIAAVLAGWARNRGWTLRLAPAVAVFLVGHAVLLAMGAGWLAAAVGLKAALEGGLWPFLPGAAVKSALLAATTVTLGRRDHLNI